MAERDAFKAATFTLLPRIPIADQPAPREPAPLTVAEALRLPEVRSGARWVESMGAANVLRRWRYDGSLGLRMSINGGAWGVCLALYPEEIESPCTLIAAPDGGR